MAEDAENQATDASETTQREPLRGMRDRWQVPVLLLATGLLGLGIYRVMTKAEGPDFDGVLEQSREMIAASQPEESLALLNGPIRMNLEHELATPRIRAMFYAQRGDALYLLTKARENPTPADHKAVLAEYDRAKEHDATVLDETRRGREIDSLVALGRLSDAQDLIESISPTRQELKHNLMRKLIDASLEQGGEENTERALRDLARLKADTSATEEIRLWTVGRQADVRIASGNPEAAARDLLPAIQRMTDRTSPEAGRLLAKLGRAHLELGELAEARKRFDMALVALPDGSIDAGGVEASLGQIDMMEGETEQARDRFAVASERYRLSPVLVRSSMGLGESEAELGHFDESLKAYNALAELLKDPDDLLLEGRDLGALRREIERSLSQRYRDRFLNDDLENALAFAKISESLFPANDIPNTVTRRLADTHRRIAETLLREAVGGDTDVLPEIEDVEPATAEEARVQFYLAGEYYHRHAKGVITSDAQASADSLWLAADSYDRAGDLSLAIRFFGEYAASRTGDPRQLEARFRLAQAHQALGAYDNAIGIYEDIIEENPTSTEAYRSHVPLARAAMLVSEEGDIARAEKHLLSVLDGTFFDPDSPQFRQALIELGRVYRTAGRHPEAIERLREALERYPDAEERDRVSFDLADSLRLSSAEIDKELNLAMPQSRRLELTGLRETRLREALALYDGVRESIDGIAPTRRTPLQDILLRNALFYRGDCAFELVEYELAIEYYDAAAQRYANDPVSLVAMVQIVNAHAALGQWRQAKTAHARAKVRLQEIPEETWARDDLPMRREHWERWLDASIRLDDDQMASVPGG